MKKITRDYLGHFVATLILAIYMVSLNANAATIRVTSQIGEPGCDLVEAIDTATFLTAEHSNELNYYRESQMLETQHIKESLSTRQFETLTLLSKGLSNLEIADNMKITESTVKSHVSSLMELFEATNRTHCVSEARRLKLLD